MVATSLDLYDVVTKNYPDAISNLVSLRKLGATIMHGVDATKMKKIPALERWKFDRIIYNFPHAGFHGKETDVRMIEMHKDLVLGFFRNASQMLRPSGKIHINHKTTEPYDKWDLKGLAKKHDLSLVGCVEFREEDYPGYNNKKGFGPKCNEPFHLGECSTFKFKFFHCVKKFAPGYIHSPSYQIQRIHLQVQNLPLFKPGHLAALPGNQGVPLQTHNPTPLNVSNPTRHQVQHLPSRLQNQILFDVGYSLVEVNMSSNFWYFGSPYAPRML
ncbi:hypothetical protein MKX03_000973 [Papaver bracteatum]|nr:hypothetical protein MKX03_000973 [Papaver bracteatum]